MKTKNARKEKLRGRGKKKKEKKYPYNLEKSQILFIDQKVKDLGSLKSVKKFYNRDDAVSKYAISRATKLYSIK